MSSSSVCYFALVAGPRGAGYGAAAASAARPWIGSRKTTRPNDTRTVTYARCRCWLALFQPLQSRCHARSLDCIAIFGTRPLYHAFLHELQRVQMLRQ